VAAYLVGERGTVVHALLLGLVTTLTHTGVVIAIAIALRIYFPYGGISEAARQELQMALGLGGGLLVAGLGLWLLLRRLNGQADHFHFGGHGHHAHTGHSHDHGALDHYHDEQGHAHPLALGSQPLDWWRLVLLGASGGIVPCWDAILMLLVAVSTNLLWLALPMLLAFSAGLASVLIAIGIFVVRVKGFAGARWGQGRLFRTLPVVSAVLVTGLGLWLCYDSVHVNAKPISAHARP
jgi:nickel/cobalt transporter (NicO) family protein